MASSQEHQSMINKARQYFAKLKEQSKANQLVHFGDFPLLERQLDELNSFFVIIHDDFKCLEEEDQKLESNKQAFFDIQETFHEVAPVLMAKMLDCLSLNQKGGNDSQSLQSKEEEDKELHPPIASGINSTANQSDPMANQLSQQHEQTMDVDSDKAESATTVPQEQAKFRIPLLSRSNSNASINNELSQPHANENWEDDLPIELTLSYRQHFRMLEPIHQLKQLEVVNERSLQRILDAIFQVNAQARSLNYKLGKETQTIIGILYTILDEVSKAIWQYHFMNQEPTIEAMIDFITRRVQMSENPIAGTSNQKYTGTKPKVSPVEPAPKKAKYQCPHCNYGDHPLFRCELFTTSTLIAKQRTVGRAGLCVGCFASTHKVQQCKEKPCKRCRVIHNSLMCPRLAKNLD